MSHGEGGTGKFVAGGLAFMVIMPMLLLFFLGGGTGASPASACGSGNTSAGGDAAVGPIAASPGGPVYGKVALVQANLPSKAGYLARGAAGMRRIAATGPDFVTLNEQAYRNPHSLTQAVHGYAAWRDSTHDRLDAGHSDKENVVAWKTSMWKKVDSGRVRLITQKEENGVIRSRYAVWVILQSTSDPHTQVVVVAVHMPVNPQPGGGTGPVRDGRSASYGVGMDNLISLINTLSAYGPVLVGGDFNNHPWQSQRWAAVPHMRGAGYDYTDSPRSGIDYVFYPPGVQVAAHRDLASDGTSDHPDYNLTELNMNGVGPGVALSDTGSTGTGSTGTGSTGTGSTGTGSSTQAVTSTSTSTGSGGFTQTGHGGYRVAEWTLNADQYANAKEMVSLAASRGGNQAAVVVITAALAESGLSTDPGSLGGALGVLQETPAQGWGSHAQVMQVEYATNTWLNHLLAVPGWPSMPPWHAAQAVSRSGAGDVNGNHHLDPEDGSPNYGPKVAEAQAIVAALIGAATTTATTCPAAGAPSGSGSGPFTASSIPYVGPFDPATLTSRMQAIIRANGLPQVDPFFPADQAGADGSWYRDCQHFVAVLDGHDSSGYGSAASAWSSFLASGKAHPAGSTAGMSPPPGAWLYYGDNHVVLYLGGNLVAGTDTWGTGTAKVGPASAVETWLRSQGGYKGWVAPPWGIQA